MLRSNITVTGDLYILVKEHNDTIVQSVIFDNKTEFNFVDDELVSILFPNFQSYYPYGPCNEHSQVEIKDVGFNNDIMVLSLSVDGFDMSVTIDISPLKNRNI